MPVVTGRMLAPDVLCHRRAMATTMGYYLGKNFSIIAPT